jgi:diguanylate cyclase (GGDEF)-like protein
MNAGRNATRVDGGVHTGWVRMVSSGPWVNRLALAELLGGGLALATGLIPGYGSGERRTWVAIGIVAVLLALGTQVLRRSRAAVLGSLAVAMTIMGLALIWTTDPTAAGLMVAPVLLGAQYAAFLMSPGRWLWCSGYAVLLVVVAAVLNRSGLAVPQRIASVVVVGFGLWMIGRLYVQTYLLATRDPLTGAYSRAAIHRMVGEAIAVADRRRYVLAVADLDGLKRINDASGHQAGDRALLAMVRSLRTVADAKAGRIGGDEFVLLVSGVDEVEAQRRLMVARERSQVSWTFGLTVLRPGDSLDEATARADRCLYRGKSSDA